MKEKRTEYLGSGVSVIVSDEHGFGTDAVLLADFAKPKRKDIACDFGTGCGIIPLLWYRNSVATEITGVEIREQGCRQASDSVKLSGAEEKIRIINCDLKQIKDYLPPSSMTLVTMNPPYKADGCGIQSDSQAEKIARHETMCTINDITSSASYLLNFGGRLCLCNRPERLVDTLCAMREVGIEPKRLRFVSKNADSKPWLFMVEGRKGGKPFMNVEAPLIMYSSPNELSAQVVEIYGEYKEKIL